MVSQQDFNAENLLKDYAQGWMEQFMDPERIPLAIAAIILAIFIGMLTGPRAGQANPAAWMLINAIFGGIGDRLDKTERKAPDLLFRGFLVTAVAIFAALGLLNLIEWGLLQVGAGTLGQVLLISLFMSAGSVWFVLLRLFFALQKKSVGQGAYFALAQSSRTNLSASDDFGITRCAITYGARSFDKALVAPVFWYLIAGFEMLCLYAVLSALAWRFGKDGFSKGFGAIPLGLERLMGFIPGYLSGFLLTLAAIFTPTARSGKGVVSWFAHEKAAPYEQGGMALTSVAWSLGLSLGGPRQDLRGSSIKSQWVGPEGASAKVDRSHLKRAIYIHVMAHILFIAVLLGAYLWGSGSMGSFLSKIIP